MVSVELQPAFGCVVFDVLLTWVLLFWMMMKVGGARKKYGVKVQIFLPYCPPVQFAQWANMHNFPSGCHLPRNRLEKQTRILESIVCVCVYRESIR